MIGMLLLINVILILWVSTVAGPVRFCNLPEINHGILYDQKRYKPFLPVHIGKFLYYSCEYNYVSPSKSFLTRINCTEEGWSPTPKCLRECYFPSVENGYSLSSGKIHLEGETVQIDCDLGYNLQHNEHTITCAESGWSSPPKCTKKCSQSDIVVENGFVTEKERVYYLNKEIQFKCKPGYSTIDGRTTGTITCLENGWSTQPVCIKYCVMPEFVNARKKGNTRWFKFNDKLDYECNDGYESRDGSTTGSIVCGEGGWSHLPMCYEIECPLPLLEENVNAYPKQEKYKVGDVLKFSCRQKLIRVGPDSIQCYQFGWSPNFPTCKGQVQSCGPPPQLPNGKIKFIRKEEYGHSEVVEYDCNPSFLMKGPNKIQCMDGEWTTLPTCVEQVKTCEDIPKLNHGYVLPSVPPFRHGDSLELKCTNAYTMIGNKRITCVSGVWTQLPKCVATDQLKMCKRSKLYTKVMFRSHLYEFNHNTTINYRCFGKQKYMQTVCINGKWDPEPDCTEKETQPCPPPPQIPNAQNMITTVNYQDGEKVAVLCKENYLLREAKEIMCKNGRWQSLPRCIDYTENCGPPPYISNGDITSFQLKDYPPGSTVEYHCQSFYELQGSANVTCRNGQWSEPPRCIDACIISEEDMNKNNIQLKWKNDKKLYVKTGDFVDFDCKETYKAKTPSQSFHTMCQEGEVEYPRCE
ncbi:complement factor H-related protein 5 isoform X2 [Dasypus novemcinctus]|uniref:complement factor H-related protein 5 isoform X2 n=1 Tax=Dasypus novemcinctus TaxID=9361 RepID=UPI00265EAE01|nr:complement factor H-related protein 5 isoform X2 [Dasypus novemcinctus]